MPLNWQTVGGVVSGVLRQLFRVKRLWVVLGSVLAIYVLASSCSTYVPPNMIGIRQAYFGSRAGIKPESYWPGLHFIVAGFERMHLLPHDLHIINFSASSCEL